MNIFHKKTIVSLTTLFFSIHYLEASRVARLFSAIDSSRYNSTQERLREIQNILNPTTPEVGFWGFPKKPIHVAELRDTAGNTPLIRAVMSDESEIAKYLLEHGAQPSINVANKNGSTPLSIALDIFEKAIQPEGKFGRNRAGYMITLLFEYGAAPQNNNEKDRLQNFLYPSMPAQEESEDDQVFSSDRTTPRRAAQAAPTNQQILETIIDLFSEKNTIDNKEQLKRALERQLGRLDASGIELFQNLFGHFDSQLHFSKSSDLLLFLNVIKRHYADQLTEAQKVKFKTLFRTIVRKAHQDDTKAAQKQSEA